MQLKFKPVTPETRSDALSLHVGAGQESYVEDVAACLEEADGCSSWRPVCIYDGDVPIGFAMYGYFSEYAPSGRVWFDRLLIGAPYQGKGYGKAALAHFIEQLRAEYGRRDIYLSVVSENTQAARLYEAFGFRFTGEKDVHGEDVMVLNCSF